MHLDLKAKIPGTPTAIELLQGLSTQQANRLNATLDKNNQEDRQPLFRNASSTQWSQLSIETSFSRFFIASGSTRSK